MIAAASRVEVQMPVEGDARKLYAGLCEPEPLRVRFLAGLSNTRNSRTSSVKVPTAGVFNR